MNKFSKIALWVMIIPILSSPWITHTFYTYQSGDLKLFFIGSFIPPIGWIHGIGLWFGWW